MSTKDLFGGSGVKIQGDLFGLRVSAGILMQTQTFLKIWSNGKAKGEQDGRKRVKRTN